MALQVFVRCAARLPGEESGDAFFYSEEDRVVWLAVADGLGSGPEAAEASRKAVEYIRRRLRDLRRGSAPPPSRFLEDMMAGCDQALRHTRGAAVAITALDAGTATGCLASVGNVQMRTIGAHNFHPVGIPGIVGVGLRKIRVETFPYTPGDLIIMHSDGLSSHFTVEPNLAAAWNLEALGEHLVAEHRNAGDDLAVILLRQYA